MKTAKINSGMILPVKSSVKSELDEFSKKIDTVITEKVEENMKPLKDKIELLEAEMATFIN